MSRVFLSLVVALLFVSTAAFAADLKSGEAKGNLVIDGKSLALKYAVAVSGPDTFDETKEAFFVLLTPQPVPKATIDGAETFDDIRSAVKEGIAYKVAIGDHYHVTARYPAVLKDHELQMSASLMSDAPKITASGDTVTGAIKPWRGEAEEIASHKMNYDVMFTAPVVRRFALDKPIVMSAKAKKLPAGGGEPGKAYLAEKCGKKIPTDPKEIEAMMAKEGMLPTDDDLKKMSKEAGKPVTKADVIKQFAEMASAMSALQPTDCKVMGGTMENDVAIIQVQNKQAGQRLATDVTMIKDASGWKVKKEGAWHTP